MEASVQSQLATDVLMTQRAVLGRSGMSVR
jgi:hypothetical protein